MARADGGSRFVGREALVARLAQRLEEGQQVRADEVTGVLGMGKSTLIEEVHRRTTAQETAALVSHVDLARYDAGSKERSGEEQTFGQSLKAHDQLMQLARQVLGAVSPESVAELERVGDAGLLGIHRIKSSDVNVYNEISAGSAATVSSSPQAVTINVDNKTPLDTEFVRAIRKAQVTLSDTVASALSRAARDRPVLLLLDNADAVAGQDLGYWISRIIRQLDGCVVVLAHEPDAALDLPPGVGQSERLTPFSRTEVSEFLRHSLRETPADDLVALLHRWSGGVPVALEILVDLMNDPDLHLGRAELESRLFRLPGNAEGRLAGVITEMVERLEGRLLGRALRAASIPSECDVELLARLLDDDGVAREQTPGLLTSLEAFSFTDGYESPTDGRYYVRVHPFIRKGLADHLRKYAPEEQHRLHRVAAEFYYQQVTGSETYGEMFDLEDPARQSELRKWLHHSARSGDRRTAMLQATKVFFDSFWWWGNYVHLDFCHTLAADFAELALTSGDDELQSFADAVARFLHDYPYRAKLRQDFDRSYPPARWEDVEDALLELRDLCGLVRDADPPPEVDPLECQVAGLIEVFLAHTYRYRSPADRGDARACYEAAVGWFERSGRPWDVPWVVFETGDLALEADDVELALTQAASAASRLYADLDEDSPDEELIANIHRLRADCAWRVDDVVGAAHEYASAVVHSYLFHRIGGPPDDYTMQFYFEVRGRAIEKLIQLWRSGRGAEALQFGQALREPFVAGRALDERPDTDLTTIYETGTVSELARALFPRGPELDELGPRAGSSAFMKDLRRFQRRVAPGAARDLVQAPSS